MKNYQKDKGGFRGDKGDRGGRPPFKPSFKSRDGDRGGDREMTMYKAVCSECKKSCDVPFRPTGDKPVYCRDCFAGKRGVDERGPRPSSAAYEPKRFSNERPAFRTEAPRDAFKLAPAPSNDETKKQLADISFKLDKLINAIEKLSLTKKEVAVLAVVETPAKAVVSVKPVAKKVAVAKSVKKVIVKKAEVKKVVAKKVAPKKVITKKAK